MPTVTTTELVASLTVEEAEPGVYRGPNVAAEYRRIFGGQLLAQAIMAAAASAEGKAVKSVHMSFCREGVPDQPIDYQVTGPHTGRSFASRQVAAVQGGNTIAVGLVVLHQPDDPAGQPGYSVDAPDVDEPDGSVPVDLGMIPFDTRFAGKPDLSDRDAGAPNLATWLRADGLPPDQGSHQALLAYCSDLSLIGTELRPLAGVGQDDIGERLITAVTTHTVWFHGPADLGRWTLLWQEAEHVGGGRGFGTGRVFDHGRHLVASYAQESLIRFRR